MIRAKPAGFLTARSLGSLNARMTARWFLVVRRQEGGEQRPLLYWLLYLEYVLMHLCPLDESAEISCIMMEMSGIECASEVDRLLLFFGDDGVPIVEVLEG